MRSLFFNSLVALSAAFGSLAIATSGSAAIVNLTGSGDLNVPLAAGDGGALYFALPNDFSSLNSIELDFVYNTAVGTPVFGTSSLEFAFGLDGAASPPTGFGVGAVYGLAGTISGGTYDGSVISVGDPSYTFTLPFFSSLFNLSSLPATAPLFVAGSPLTIALYNGADGSASTATITVVSANLKLNYNATGGGGVVPEPSTLAIALVGLAGWRGRRMLRRS